MGSLCKFMLKYLTLQVELTIYEVNMLFNRIYIEEAAQDYDITKDFLSAHKNLPQIVINNHKDVFNRPRQWIEGQQNHKSVILAVGREPYLYPSPEHCESYGNDNFYYSSTIYNCIYDCRYCYLKGTFASSNIVIFVNRDDYKNAVLSKIDECKQLYVAASFDSDITALDGIFSYATWWSDLTKTIEGITVELRTKSTAAHFLRRNKSHDNIILAFSITPQQMAEKYDIGCPSALSRIKAVKKAIDLGWRVRICFEPVLYDADYIKMYDELFTLVFNEIKADYLEDVNIGLFRMNKDYFKYLLKTRLDTDVFAYPMIDYDGVLGYENEDVIKQNLYNLLIKYINKEKVFI